MTDRDHEAAERTAAADISRLTPWLLHLNEKAAEGLNLARCYQARGERIARLEALVRSLAQHGTPAPGQFAWWHKAVEAARKELENG